MKVAPLKRSELTSEVVEKFDQLFRNQEVGKEGLYLSQLRSGAHCPGKSAATFPVQKNEEDDDEVEIIGRDVLLGLFYLRLKLVHLHSPLIVLFYGIVFSF